MAIIPQNENKNKGRKPKERGITMKNVTTIAELQAIVSAENGKLSALGGDEREAAAKKIIVDCAPYVADFNAAIVADFNAAIIATATKNGAHAALMAYLAAYKCNHISAGYNKKTGEVVLNQKNHMVNWYKLEKAYQLNQSTEKNEKGEPMPKKTATLADEKGYTVPLACFIDNMVLSKSESIGTKFDTPFAAETKKRLGMDKHSKTALIEQLNIVCKAIAGKDAPKMIGCDVVFVNDVVTKANVDDCKELWLKKAFTWLQSWPLWIHAATIGLILSIARQFAIKRTKRVSKLCHPLVKLVGLHTVKQSVTRTKFNPESVAKNKKEVCNNGSYHLA
jgi:hypothetical protein